MRLAGFTLALVLCSLLVGALQPRGDADAGTTGCTIVVNSALAGVSSGDAFVTLDEATRFGYDNLEPAGQELDQIDGCPGGDDNPGVGREDLILFDGAVFGGGPTTIPSGNLCLCDSDRIDTTGNVVILDGGSTTSVCLSMNNSSNNVVIGLSVQNCVIGIGIASDGGQTSGNTVRNSHFGGNDTAIRIANASDSVIEGNRIGVSLSDPDSAQPNGFGILIGDVPSDPGETSGNMIGGVTANSRNVISGNSVYGIGLSEGADETLIQGNYIGTNVDGDAALPNMGSGIGIDGGEDIVVGGSAAGARNVISGNMGRGIEVGEDDVRIQGNYIGTNAAGTAAIPNGASGIAMTGATGALIGGTAPGTRNVISGNTFAGIDIQVAGTTDNTVQGNYIGTNAAGTAAIGNSEQGIILDGAPGNLIGGTTGNAGNVISGNNIGILVVGASAADNEILGNRVGTNAAGTGALGNLNDGVQFVESGPNHLGGPDAGEGNVIAHNGDAGVVVLLLLSPSHSKAISGNSIHSNAGLGIDLENDGVTPNDEGAGDADDGGNGLQNFPVLNVVELGGQTLHVEGTLDSRPSTDFRIELFANAACDPSGYGEGERFLGTFEASTDGAGLTDLIADLEVDAAPGEFLTATAIDEDDNTSEFSLCVEIIGVATPTPEPTETPGPTVTPAPSETPVATPTPGPSVTPGPKGLLGDTDCDEDVDSVDSLWVLREVAGLSFDAECIAAGDVQCDGDRDSVDALGIQRHVAALPQIGQTEPCRDIGT